MVLLDDIFSELDRTNAEYLFGNLSGDWQVIASALTEQEMLADFKVIKL
jgi:recombinational DNA repair ATPase RecF